MCCFRAMFLRSRIGISEAYRYGVRHCDGVDVDQSRITCLELLCMTSLCCWYRYCSNAALTSRCPFVPSSASTRKHGYLEDVDGRVSDRRFPCHLAMAETYENIYGYDASLSLALCAAAIFCVISFLHTYQMIRSRAWLFVAFVTGAYCKLTILAKRDRLQLTPLQLRPLATSSAHSRSTNDPSTPSYHTQHP